MISSGLFRPNIHIETTQDIIESKYVMYDEVESSSRGSPADGRERDQRAGLDTLGLTETEAVEYVLMLSRDEANDRARVKIEDDGVFQGDFDDEREDAFDDYGAPPLSSSASSGSASSGRSSVTTSPGLRSIRVGRPIPALQGLAMPRASPLSLSSSNSSSNQKVQVSPPYQVEPMEAGTEWLEGGRSENGTIERSGLEDHHFPPVVGTRIGDPTRKIKRPEDVTHKRGEPSKAKSTLTSSSAWSTPLTKKLANRDSSAASFAPSTSQFPNLSPAFGPAQPSAAAVCDGFDMDEDLRFAIELSLAEASSRRE